MAAGIGIALAAAPATASADAGAPSTADSSAQRPERAGATPASRQGAVPSAQTGDRVGPAVRRIGGAPAAAAASPVQRASVAAGASPRATAVTPRAGSTIAATGAAYTAVTTLSATAEIAPGSTQAVVTASAAPTIGALPALLRLSLEDLFTGTGPAMVTNPSAVVTGLFNQVLRKDPTPDELQNYLGVLGLTGVNGVVAGLYSSDLFRQTVVNNYYLELLSRTATQQEISWGATQLFFGLPEPLFAASIAGSRQFYQVSASGGGQFGTQPTDSTYVDLLYRTLLGQATDPTAGAVYLQRLQAGQPIGLAALNFVTADAFRSVKVGEIYQVLGQTPTQSDVAQYVRNWFLQGGLAGIATSLLAASTNVARIEGGQVALPDIAAAAQLQQLLLTAYTDAPDGFVKLFNQLLSLDPTNPIGGTNPCTPTNTSCNQALYQLVTTGGTDRGIPNTGLTLTSMTANVATLVPTQNEIDLQKSLKFPLQDPSSLNTYFTGGVIQPFGNPIVTANDGTYIVDGHHRWSGIVLVNPYTQVTALDLGYVPVPQSALKEAQIGVAAAKGYLAVAPGGGINLYTCDEAIFNATVREYIETAASAHPNDPNPEVPWTDQVLAVFTGYLGLEGQTVDEKYTSIENYLWANVLRMRELNPFIPGATSREVMPQTDPLPVVQGYLASGALSYSFPTISYLG